MNNKTCAPTCIVDVSKLPGWPLSVRIEIYHEGSRQVFEHIQQSRLSVKNIPTPIAIDKLRHNFPEISPALNCIAVLMPKREPIVISRFAGLAFQP